MTSQRFYLFIDIGGLIRFSNAKKSKLLIKALFLDKQNLKIVVANWVSAI